MTKTDSGSSSQTKSGQDIPRPPLSNVKQPGKARAKKSDKDDSPPALGRKEQAARARMQSAKRTAGSSIFSMRPNPPSPGQSSSYTPHVSQSSTSRLPTPAPRRANGVGMKGKGPADTSDLRALCPDRGSRDQRTIDEIQRDIKLKRSNGVSQLEPAPQMTSDLRYKKVHPHDNKDRMILPSPRSRTTSSNIRPPARRRSPSTSSSSSSSDSSEAPSRKKSKSGTGNNGGHKSSNRDSNISSMIQDMFRRPGRPATARNQYDSDSEGSDMEAGLSDVEEEERRAVYIARREDELAEKEERARKEKKDRMKREREMGLVK